jgi:transcriptional antiterminator NusG
VCPLADKQINWYVLFVRTGAEERLVEQLKYEFGENDYFPFVPKKTAIYRRKGVKSEFQQICFPGYVFLESDKSAEDVMNDSRDIIYKQRDAYRFLNYGEKHEIAMREKERLALSKLFGVDRSIDISKGFKEGDRIKIISGSLLDFEGTIKRINTGQKQAVVELSMFGTVVDVTVGLEIVKVGS